MSEPDKFKLFVRHIIQEVRCLMLLQEWRIDFSFDKKFDDEGCMASIKVSGNYLECTINIAKKMRRWFNDNQFEDIARILVHELSHLFTEPLFDIAYDATPTGVASTMVNTIREQQTSRIANAIFGLLPPHIYRGPIDET